MKKSYIIIGILLIAVVIGCTNQKNTPVIQKKEVQETASFIDQYPMAAADHKYVETDIYKINNLFTNQKTGVVLLAFPECPFCKQVIPILDQVAKDNAVEQIFYFNALEERKNNSKAYQTLINNISLNLSYDEYGKHQLVMPLILFIKDGVLVSSYQGSVPGALVDSDELDPNLTSILYNKLNQEIQKIKEEELME